jgi:hypothetical protein
LRDIEISLFSGADVDPGDLQILVLGRIAVATAAFCRTQIREELGESEVFHSPAVSRWFCSVARTAGMNFRIQLVH